MAFLRRVYLDGGVHGGSDCLRLAKSSCSRDFIKEIHKGKKKKRLMFLYVIFFLKMILFVCHFMVNNTFILLIFTCIHLVSVFNRSKIVKYANK